jgi:predicted glutamine amidotransferase
VEAEWSDWFAMCEVLAVRWPAPTPFSALLHWARRLEQYGLGGFGWGVAWLEGDQVRNYRFPGALHDDAGAGQHLHGVRSTSYLLHLRRPSKLSTTQLADTQPFLHESGAFAFCHNGAFTNEPEFRAAYAGRLAGAADSEVGFRMLEDLLDEPVLPEEALVTVHDRLGGNANLGLLCRGGDRLLVMSAHRGNALWRFRVEDAEVAATALHSHDESLFDLVFEQAEERRVVEGVAAVERGR